MVPLPIIDRVTNIDGCPGALDSYSSGLEASQFAMGRRGRLYPRRVRTLHTS